MAKNPQYGFSFLCSVTLAITGKEKMVLKGKKKAEERS